MEKWQVNSYDVPAKFNRNIYFFEFYKDGNWKRREVTENPIP